MINRIRGIRQGIPGGTTGFVLGRQAGARGNVTAIPLPGGQGASATATAGGFIPQSATSVVTVNFNGTGAWSAVVGYDPGDVATFNGAAYVNYDGTTAPGPNPAPDVDPTHWIGQGDVQGLAPLASPAFTGEVSIAPAAAPAPPATGWSLYVDTATGNLNAIASTGTIVTLGIP